MLNHVVRVFKKLVINFKLIKIFKAKVQTKNGEKFSRFC